MSTTCIVLFYLIGWLIYRNHSEKQFAFIRAFGLFISVMIGNGVIMLLLLSGFIFVLFSFDEVFLGDLLSEGRLNTSLFLLYLLVFILLTAIIHYGIRQYFIYRKNPYSFDLEDYEICEYFIQWTTIYVVVYQFLFDGLSSVMQLIADKQTVSSLFSVILSPNNINLVVQPLLIATWIVIVMDKFKVRNAVTE